MKKAIFVKGAVAAVMMILISVGQVMAGQNKTKKEELTIWITEKAGVDHCDCECFPEEPVPLDSSRLRQACHCECSLSDGSGPGFIRTEEKMFRFTRSKK